MVKMTTEAVKSASDQLRLTEQELKNEINSRSDRNKNFLEENIALLKTQS